MSHEPGNLTMTMGASAGIRRIYINDSRVSWQIDDIVDFKMNRPSFIICNVSSDDENWCLIIDEMNACWEEQHLLTEVNE